MAQTEKQKWAQFNYQTDPTTHAIIDTMVNLAVPDPDPGGYDPHQELRRVAARDFFLFGTTMVVGPPGTWRQLVRPWEWRLLPEGEAEFLGEVPSTYEGPRPPVVPPEDYLLLVVSEDLPPPIHEEGEVLGAEPWLTAWAKASKDLESFLARAA